jgi:hypothetical protein
MDDGLFYVSRVVAVSDENGSTILSSVKNHLIEIKNRKILSGAKIYLKNNNETVVLGLRLSSKGEPVTDTDVIIKNSEGRQTALTDSNGIVKFSVLSGLINYTVSADDYFNVFGTFNISGDTQKIISLDPSKTLILHVAEEIRDFENVLILSKSQNSSEVLESLTLSGKENYYIKVVASDKSYIEVWYDGFPDIYEVSESQTDLNLTFIDRVKRSLSISDYEINKKYSFVLFEKRYPKPLNTYNLDIYKGGVFELKIRPSTYRLALVITEEGENFIEKGEVRIYDDLSFVHSKHVNISYEKFDKRMSLKKFITETEY